MTTMNPTLWWSALVLLAGAPALAQDSGAEDPTGVEAAEPGASDPGAETSASEPGPAAGDDSVVGTLDVMAPPYSEGWRWVRRSPVRGEAVLDVAAHPANPDRLAAVAEDGTVWVSRDGGRIWGVALGGAGETGSQLSNDEDVLLDIDARLGEILADQDTGSINPDFEDDEVQDAIEDSVNQAIDDGGSEILTDLESDPGFVLRGRGEREDHEPRVMYVGTDLFVSLDHTLSLSRDGGESWGEVLDQHVFDIVRLGGLSVALTEDGARVALDARAWIDVQDGTEGLGLTEGATSDEVLLAATASGLWATRDGQTWKRWGSLDQPVTAIATHPERPETVWIITPTGLRRSDDRGLTFGEPVLEGRLDDVIAPLPDRVLVARPGTLLESMDRGLSWTPATAGLTGVSSGHLEVATGGGAWLAAEDGLWSLVRSVDDGPREVEPWVGLRDLVQASLDRVGVRRDFNAFSRRYAAAAIPRLFVDGYVIPTDVDETWRSGTTLTERPRWRIRARLVWTPRTNASRGFIDARSDASIDTNVVIVDGEALLLTGTDDYVVAARLERSLLEGRADTAGRVSDLYRTRSELVAERPRLRDAALLRRVNHELAIAELEAQLDALTDGAVRRWQASQSLQSQEL